MKIKNKKNIVSNIIVLVLFLFFMSCAQEPKLKEKQLTFGDGPDSCPNWSPDGNMIAFHSQRSGTADIWIVPSTGGEPKKITSTEQDENWPKFSPDGKHIAFVRFTQEATKGFGNIFIIDTEGRNERQITDDGTMKFCLAWDTESKSIIYGEGRGTGDNFETDIWSINIETKEKQKFIEGYKEATKKGLSIIDFNFNQYGDSLVYSGTPEPNSYDRWLFIMDMKTHKYYPIVTDLYRPWFTSWNPFNKLIAFQSGKLDNSEIYTIQPNGKNRTTIISSGKGDRFPSWSPDGRKIAFTRGTYNNANLWIADFK